MIATKTFGIDLFDKTKTKKVLPPLLYRKICVEQVDCSLLSQKELQCYANALKRWALSRGATQFAHWFQPLTDLTAEKHTNFIQPLANGKAILQFDYTELFRGEGDASSFPNGGLRQTFEARGITKLDTHSYPFVKDGCLYIPTTFHTNDGGSLDKKVPLLLSCKDLEKSTKKLLNVLGLSCKNVVAQVGCEQEYFLIDKNLWRQRKDLIFCGRTLFGAQSAKSQELANHYYATIPRKVSQFMQDVDRQLLKLGIVAKIEHDEVAPCQYELVTCHTPAEIACDQNHLVMDVLTKTAHKHGFECLLHEKPFDYVNGSGKHVNWSITNDGNNLLSIGATPLQNALFLATLCAIIQSVDTYQELLRVAISSLGNDYRLGQNEAPGNIISVFIGDKLSSVFEDITNGKFLLGKDTFDIEGTTDRNRTSPFAYTGNKFEFRSVGSSGSVADAITILNVTVADSLNKFAEKLQNATNVWEALTNLIAQTYLHHKKIVYNGNNYSDEWKDIADKRELANVTSTACAIEALTLPKNVELLCGHGIFCEQELQARKQIITQQYVQKVQTEVATAVKMVNGQVLPIATEYLAKLQAYAHCNVEKYLNSTKSKLQQNITNCYDAVEALEKHLEKGLSLSTCQTALKLLQDLRAWVDNLEQLLPQELWKMPTYDQILYGAN